MTGTVTSAATTVRSVSPSPDLNVLLITLDQFRGDCLSAAGHPVVKTPNLDALADNGVRFSRHYSQAAPCGPGRAALYTGTYQMNNRVVGNGTPLDPRFTNVALELSRAGYEPTLFGYTDVAFDPRLTDGPDDPRLNDYEGVLDGFTQVLDLSDDVSAWTDWLATMGVTVTETGWRAIATESSRPADLSLSAFTTDELTDWIDAQDAPWFAHASYLRPHPPYNAAGRFSAMYDEDALPPVLPAQPDLHPLVSVLLGDVRCVPPTDRPFTELQAQYYGMVSEVDHQLGRLWAAMRENGAWDNTLIIVTADHGEQMGDRGLLGKLGFFPESFHIPGIVRDPRSPTAFGSVVDEVSENVDIMPTILEALGLPVPSQCDGLSLMPFVQGNRPPVWRDAAHHEFDWRDGFLGGSIGEWPWDRRLEANNVAALHDAQGAYVHFGDGSSLCFDLALDPTWQTLQTDPATVLSYAQRMLTWRATHTDRTLADFRALAGGQGRWPANVPWREP
jgi:arylsulfatase A-like enzyme